MTKQEFFNKSVAGVIKQGALSKNFTGHCLYRGPDGLKCAIGHVINDDEVIENERAIALLPFRHGRFNHLWDLAQNLQGAHDASDDIKEFIANARCIGIQMGLDVSVCAKESNESFS